MARVNGAGASVFAGGMGSGKLAPPHRARATMDTPLTAARTAEWRTHEAHVRSEAVYLDAVDADARNAIVVRICRYPALGTQWLWLHLFTDGELRVFTSHALPCPNVVTDLTNSTASYEFIGADSDRATQWLVFERSGPLAAPHAALARLALDARRETADTHDASCFAVPEHGPGRCRVEGEIAFTAHAAPVSNREGRHEMLGQATVSLAIDGEPLAFTARAHFHEQEQDDPRFTLPFSYATLRSATRGFVFIRGVRGVRGQFLEGTRSTAIVRVDLEPPAARRAIRLVLEDGRQMSGVLAARCRYVVPIFDEPRPGSFVTLELDGEAYSGCVNDYLVDRLPWTNPAAHASEGGTTAGDASLTPG